MTALTVVGVRPDQACGLMDEALTSEQEIAGSRRVTVRGVLQSLRRTIKMQGTVPFPKRILS